MRERERKRDLILIRFMGKPELVEIFSFLFSFNKNTLAQLKKEILNMTVPYFVSW